MLLVDGTAYEVLHTFSATRVLIDMGVPAFADRNHDGSWSLSGEPARPDEMVVLKALTDPTNDQTIVTVTKNN